MVLAAVEPGRFVERIEDPVDAHTGKTGASHLVEFFTVFALTAANDGREHHDAVALARQFAAEHSLDDLFAGLSGNGAAAVWAMRYADGAVDDAEIIVNFRDGAHRRTR